MRRTMLTGAVLGICAATPLAAQTGLPAGTRIDTVAAGLEHPWAIAFAGEGRIFLTERPGRIRVIEGGRLRAEPWHVLPVAAGGAGLLGLALDPDFQRTPIVYVTGSFPTGRDSVYVNRLYAIRDSASFGGSARVLLDGLPSQRAHAGSAVAFGPDGKLYVTLGDAFEPERAQDAAALHGRILRLERDGSAAADNPTPGSRTYALGLRNPQGLAWDPGGRWLFATEHGPSSWPWENGRTGNDELNVIRAGGNYGWPAVMGTDPAPPYRPSIAVWSPAIAPSGIAFYAGAHEPWRNSLLIGTLRGMHIRRVQLERADTPEGWRVIAEEQITLARPTRFRAVAIGPDGHVYVTTDRRRSVNDTPDDLLLRIVLPATVPSR